MRGVLAIEGGSPAVAADAHQDGPLFDDNDRDGVNAVLDQRRWSGGATNEVASLQDEYAEYVGRRFCRAVNSGTAGLHCALVAVNVRPGDEVIVPAFGFSAIPLAVVHAGATPVFCDVDARTFNIDPGCVAGHITERTAAIVAAHIHGLPADMFPLTAISQAHDIPLVEDAAQAHGARYHGRMAGTLGRTAAFSLQATKNLQALAGGLVLCDRPEMFEAVDRLAHYGEDTAVVGPGETRSYWSRSVGYNYRMHDCAAALARTQLRKLDAYNDRARENAALLTGGLSMLAGIAPPYAPDDVERVYWGYRVLLDPKVFGWDGHPAEFRDRVIVALRAERVDADTWQLHPLAAHPAFRREPRAWTPDAPPEPPRPWNPELYPVTIGVLNNSFVLLGRRNPLWLQTDSLMYDYLEAVRKVFERIEVVMRTPIERLRPVPPIPDGDL